MNHAKAPALSPGIAQKVYVFSKEGYPLSIYSSIKHASRTFGIDPKTMYSYLDKKKLLQGEYYLQRNETFKKSKLVHPSPLIKRHSRKPIYQFNKQGKPVAIYPCLESLVEKVNTPRHVLKSCIARHSLFEGEYYFQYKPDFVRSR